MLTIISKGIKYFFTKPNLLATVLLVKLSFLFPDKLYLQLMYRLRMGKRLNLDHPVTFNEKLQWLKLYNRDPRYTVMVDKVKAKEYVASIIGEEHLAVRMRQGELRYYSVFGQYVLTPEVFDQLQRNIQKGAADEHGEVELTTALEQVRERQGLMGVQLDGEMFDMGIPDAFKNAVANFQPRC